MANYAIYIDGKPKAHAGTVTELREWLQKYGDEHRDDDPGAAHVQVLERKGLAWLTGGRLVSPDRFLRD